MQVSEIITELNSEIERLQKVRALLVGKNGYEAPRVKKKRVLSAAARAKIGAAQRKRWAKQKASAK
jgi:hypothetical protein